MTLECKKCSYMVAVQGGDRPPPWCPRCGSDLKSTGATLGSPVLVASAAAFSTSNDSIGVQAEALTPDLHLYDNPETNSLSAAPPFVPGNDETALASPEEVFRGKLIWQALAFVCVVVCFGIAGIAVSQLIHPPLKKSTQSGIYGVMVMFGIGGLVSAYVAFRLCGQKYAVFSDRLVEWQSFKPTTIRWDQIREVFQDAHPAWTKFRVVTSMGRVLKINGEIKNHKRLGELISRHVAALLLPAALKELEAGRDVRLGPLRVSRAGVTIDGELLPWHRIGMLTLGLNPIPKRGTSMLSALVHVRIGGYWVELGDIPNYRLFEELAGRLFPACVVS